MPTAVQPLSAFMSLGEREIMPKNIDLDEGRAERREALGEAPTVTLMGKVFNLPVEMPLDIADHMVTLSDSMKKKDGSETTRALFKIMHSMLEDQYDAFLALHPAAPDLGKFVAGIPDIYGLEVGESGASAKSSKTTSAQPRRRSKPTTK